MGILIFVSYATKDSARFKVPYIAEQLTKYPEIDDVLYWEEDMHDDIYKYMNDNLKTCQVFILFCSENTSKSQPIEMEWTAALKLNKKMIPIFIKEEHIPPLLTTKLGIQFNDKNLDETIVKIYKLVLKKLSEKTIEQAIKETQKDISESYFKVEPSEEYSIKENNYDTKFFRIKITNQKHFTVENIIVNLTTFTRDNEKFLQTSDCYWEQGNIIQGILNPSQEGIVNLFSLKIKNNYWNILNPFADDYRFGWGADIISAVRMRLETNLGHKAEDEGYLPRFPTNLIFKLKITAKDMPPLEKYFMFQIYVDIYSGKPYYQFKEFDSETFEEELNIQYIVGTISRSKLKLEEEFEHMEILNDLLPVDYEKYLNKYLERVDKRFHDEINNLFNKIKQFRSNHPTSLN